MKGAQAFITVFVQNQCTHENHENVIDLVCPLQNASISKRKFIIP